MGANHYVNNYICDTCVGASQFVDGANAVNCLSSCANYLFDTTVSNLKICSDFVTCAG